MEVGMFNCKYSNCQQDTFYHEKPSPKCAEERGKGIRGIPASAKEDKQVTEPYT